MSRGGALAAPLVCCLALGSALGQAPEPLLDQWLETYQASRKVGWEHLQVDVSPAGGYRVRRRAWIPLDDGLLTREEVAQVDSSGLIQRWERTDRSPGREVHDLLEASAPGEVVLTRQLGTDDPARVEAPGPPLAWALLGLRWARGELVLGPRHAYLLELPGLVSRPVALDVQELPGGAGLRLEAPQLRVDFDRQGHLRRVRHREQVATDSLPCDAADAQRPERSRPVPRGLGPSGELPFPLHGLELRPPTPSWRLTRRATRDGLELGLAHPTGTRIRVLHLPQRTPSRDRPTCERLGAALVADPPEPRLELSDPRVATHGDGLAVVFRWRERRRMLPPAEGEAMLVAGREGGLLILATAPRGGVPPHAAVAGIRALPTPRETITLAQLGLRFAVPRRWEELEPGDYASPDRLARFTVEHVEVPILTKPSAYQRQLLGNLSRLVADARTDDRMGELAGRPGRLVTIRGQVRGQAREPLPARIHCAIFVHEQVLTAVTAVAIGAGQAGAELDDTWASVQWRAEVLEGGR